VIATGAAREGPQPEREELHRLISLGRLSAGVTHDLRNFVTALDGYARSAAERLSEDHPAFADVCEIRRIAERSAALLRQLLAFSRRRPREVMVVDLNGAVEGMARMLRRLLGEDVRVSLALSPALGRIEADLAQVEQVILNLAVNARDAMPTGGELRIETCPLPGGGPLPGPGVRLRVSDTGVGMPPEVLSRIFDPFFTTKPDGAGTGLGLAIVQEAVADSGGRLRVESTVGGGTTFEIDWPVRPEGLGGPAGTPAEVEVAGGMETVLVVEDDAAVRTVLSRDLRRRGYAVLEAAGGEEALGIADEHAGAVHALVTDLVMPEMSGRDLAVFLTEARPELKVLYVTGQEDHVLVHQLREHQPGALLEKPFPPQDLARRLRDLLDRG
jgi:two-component system, cell cycle sensor histidine kinase and response regulator CckA